MEKSDTWPLAPQEHKPWAGPPSIKRAIRMIFNKGGYDFSLPDQPGQQQNTQPLVDKNKKPKEPSIKPAETIEVVGEERRNEEPRLETLVGLDPTIEKLGEKVFSYTYSGLELVKKGATKGSVHLARIDLPWNGKALLLERTSPNHEAQDSITLVVDWQKQVVTWVRADGVTKIRHTNPDQARKNDSATFATALTKKVATIYPPSDKDTLADWEKEEQKWQAAATQGIHNLSQVFNNRGLEAAASVDCGLLMKYQSEAGKSYRINSLRIGSTAKIDQKTGQMKTGDYGGREVWVQINNQFQRVPTWPVDLERNFAGSVENQSAKARQKSESYSADNGLTLTSFTDGLKPISQGVEQGVMDRLVTIFSGNDISGELNKVELQKLLGDGRYINSADDASLIAISLPSAS
ncbi:MAG: hypothetical protein UX28_C0003G0111 [Candidatus Pacebacteria bacterium GW2011_GWA1_46_10]|nr:MAG: hypothetical protein UX28_C0003G0111 [Candidatus Pacebacteria bacterium GW2011_GWA1_46_10]HCR81630.1 hypothetical protein [Candidatus Paceibacterota bacterium]